MSEHEHKRAGDHKKLHDHQRVSDRMNTTSWISLMVAVVSVAGSVIFVVTGTDKELTQKTELTAEENTRQIAVIQAVEAEKFAALSAAIQSLDDKVVAGNARLEKEVERAVDIMLDHIEKDTNGGI